MMGSNVLKDSFWFCVKPSLHLSSSCTSESLSKIGCSASYINSVPTLSWLVSLFLVLVLLLLLLPLLLFLLLLLFLILLLSVCLHLFLLLPLCLLPLCLLPLCLLPLCLLPLTPSVLSFWAILVLVMYCCITVFVCF